ncbi:autotransporter domain-containing protein [Rhizobium sp. Leaf262]|uniref:autotransporter outer membrane beta-barrel domain-containing protein n=1 Tax=Rhizobium sp. Leaf262 TaxID=1736312 RepID=UPI00071465E1|nr:autotransporter domain-containing protein [Rhizobium sp. Leaf262]KQO77710.1 hypothetical protein ASF29_05690 [Rhizobium sp. Leaf262]
MTHRLLSALSRRLGIFTALASLALNSPSVAQSVWTGNADNEFGNGANWTPDQPGAADSAEVTIGSPQVTDTQAIDRLTIDGGNLTVTNMGVLNVTNGSTITSGSLGINADGVLNSNVELNGGSLFVDGTLNGRLRLNNGNVSVNGAASGAEVSAGTALSNNGSINDVSVSTGGTFTNNGGGTTATLTNAGTASNAGTIGSVDNASGSFTNNVGGTVTGKINATGGTVTNNFIVTDADVAAAASFYNNSGATAGNIRNGGTVENAGTVASLQNDAGNFTNNVGGRITGTTTVSGGTVTNNFVVTDADVAAAAALVNNSGASAGSLKNSGTVTNAGTIALLQNNAGTFTNNVGGRITGNTTIAGGTVTNNFVVTDVDVAAAAAFVNNSGAEARTVKNSGTATNSGRVASLENRGGLFTNNTGGTVAGTTRITGGQVVNNASLSDIEIETGGTFTNNRGATAAAVLNSGTASNDGTIASLVNESGTFVNTGTISGTASVSGGELQNQGAINGAVSVFGGGLLSGSGVVQGLAVNNGGVLAPGPGLQTLTVNGGVAFYAGSIYRVDIDEAGVSDRVNASGAITINGGIVDIRRASDSYGLSTTYTILTGSNISGGFDEVVSDFAFLSPTLAYNPTTVDLHLDRNNVRFQDVALTGNDRRTAAAVENLGTASTLYRAILPLDVGTAESAFAQLNGEVHASLKSSLLSDSSLVREAILDQGNGPMRKQPESSGDASFWTTGMVAQSHFNGDTNARGTDATTAGTLVGVDVALGDNWRVGGVAGYSHLSTQPDASVDSYHAGVYTAGDIGPLSILGGAVLTRNDVSTHRKIAFGTFTDDLSADYASTTTQIFGDLALRMKIDDLAIQPFVNLAYISLDTDGFTEDGGAAALSIAPGTSDMSLSTVGIRWSANLRGGDMPVVASGMLGWRHAAGDLSPTSVSTFGGGSPFVLEGVTMPRDAMLVKAGITAEISTSARLSLTYTGEFASGFQSSAAFANLSVNF